MFILFFYRKYIAIQKKDIGQRIDALQKFQSWERFPRKIENSQNRLFPSSLVLKQYIDISNKDYYGQGSEDVFPCFSRTLTATVLLQK